MENSPSISRDCFQSGQEHTFLKDHGASLYEPPPGVEESFVPTTDQIQTMEYQEWFQLIVDVAQKYGRAAAWTFFWLWILASLASTIFWSWRRWWGTRYVSCLVLSVCDDKNGISIANLMAMIVTLCTSPLPPPLATRRVGGCRCSGSQRKRWDFSPMLYFLRPVIVAPELLTVIGFHNTSPPPFLPPSRQKTGYMF